MNDTLWVSANVKPSKTVCLWLGANIMLEYPNEEARDLLTDKLGKAKKSQEQVIEDLQFLREQITTMEVCWNFLERSHCFLNFHTVFPLGQLFTGAQLGCQDET
jgi:hypothetical protein